MVKNLVTLQLRKLIDDTAKIRQGVLRAVDKRYRRAGAIVRGVGRRLVRRSKKSSDPGKPPRTHVKSGNIGLKSIVWFYDANRKSVTIGPTSKPGESGETLTALAFGGMTTLIQRRPGKKPKRGKRVFIKKRPHMELAGEKFEKSFPDLLKDLY